MRSKVTPRGHGRAGARYAARARKMRRGLSSARLSRESAPVTYPPSNTRATSLRRASCASRMARHWRRR
eukprot:4899338-Pyramimonas_sp.AAC.1